MSDGDHFGCCSGPGCDRKVAYPPAYCCGFCRDLVSDAPGPRIYHSTECTRRAMERGPAGRGDPDWEAAAGHLENLIRTTAGVPPNAIPVMVPEEAEPVAWVNDGPWEYPVSHWPGGLRQAKAEAAARLREVENARLEAISGNRSQHPVYGLPPVTGTARQPRIIPPQPIPQRAPEAKCRFCGTLGTVWRLQRDDDGLHRCPPRTDCYSRHAEPGPASRQPRENRAPRPSPDSAVPPGIELDRCPICGMSDLGDLLHGKLAEWEGWPVHADCAEWIAGSDPAVAVQPAPAPRRLPSRSVAAVALLACMYVSSLVMVLMWLPAWGLISPLFGAGCALLALWRRRKVKR